jgi:DNA-binding MurR/RpiR family transcriptional regulator
MSEVQDHGMVTGGSVLERLSGELTGLRKSERKVAALVLDNPHFVVESTMAAVAEAATVSEPTVMRFSTSLGFDGFQSFKLALAQALALGMPVTHSALRADDDVADVSRKTFDHSISSLDRARRYLDTDRLSAAADAIMGASSLLFIGFGASAVIAKDAEQKAALFGVPCAAPEDPHQQFMAAMTSDPGTVVIAISNTGRTSLVLEVVDHARARGMTVIGITGDESPLWERSDIGIVVKTFEDTNTVTPAVSRLAALVVVDILATTVALRRGDDHVEAIREMKRALAQFRSED